MRAPRRWVHSAPAPVRFAWNVGGEAFARLRRHGYAVVDNAMPAETARALRQEMIRAAVEQTSLLSANATILVRDRDRVLVPKRGIAELDLASPTVAQQLPVLSGFAADATLAEAVRYGLGGRREVVRQTVKAQINFGGGACFPMHFDTHEGVDTRFLTAIVYLNEGYEAGRDGGQLRLYPFPNASVDIEPVFNRCVMFSSPFCLHRVLPSRTERLCFTIWLWDGTDVGAGEPPAASAPPGNAVTEIQKYLLHPRRRALLAKLHYAEEWERSIIESHDDNEQTRALIQAHRNDVHRIKSALGHHLTMLLKMPKPDLQWF
ncbi:Prolyl 4-hydroxylase alpha subunit domain-containing protein [Plasmodiophora brassicae]